MSRSMSSKSRSNSMTCRIGVGVVRVGVVVGVVAGVKE